MWRRTDPLGFPVDAYRSSAIDCAAEEFDTSTYVVSIGAHGDYQRTLVYLDELEKFVPRARRQRGYRCKD